MAMSAWPKAMGQSTVGVKNRLIVIWMFLGSHASIACVEIKPFFSASARRLGIWLLVILIGFIVRTFLVEEVSPRDVVTMPAAVSSTADGSALTEDRTNATVIRAVDGDTFTVTLDAEPGEWKIRMLGINTPESVDPRKPVECFGKEASRHLRELIEGKRVRLEADSQADERDKYGRLLRNVFLQDGTDVNATLVRDGYAQAYLSFPLDPLRKRELRTLEESARKRAVGLWSPSTCSAK